MLTSTSFPISVGGLALQDPEEVLAETIRKAANKILAERGVVTRVDILSARGQIIVTIYYLTDTTPSPAISQYEVQAAIVSISEDAAQTAHNIQTEENSMLQMAGKGASLCRKVIGESSQAKVYIVIVYPKS